MRSVTVLKASLIRISFSGVIMYSEFSRPHAGLYERFNDLKAKKPGLKTLLSVGGWSMGTVTFSEMVSTFSTRKTFIDHAVTYLRKKNFDGLDIDWEYPTERGSQAADKDLLMQLLKVYIAMNCIYC